MVDREHEIHPRVQVKGEMRVENVRLVANDHRQHDLHRDGAYPGEGDLRLPSRPTPARSAKAGITGIAYSPEAGNPRAETSRTRNAAPETSKAIRARRGLRNAKAMSPTASQSPGGGKR